MKWGEKQTFLSELAEPAGIGSSTPGAQRGIGSTLTTAARRAAAWGWIDHGCERRARLFRL